MGLVLASACSFDSSVPADATIRCQGAGDCPAGWRCSQLRQVCVPAEQSDTAGPALIGWVSPGRVRAGQPVAVRVTADEPLASPPELELLLGATTSRLDGGAEAAEDGGYAFRFAAPLVEDERPLSVFARAEDRQANLTPRALIGSVLVDGQAPRLVTADVTPGLVAPGIPVFASLLFSEPVVAAVLRIEGVERVLRIEPPSTSVQHVFVPSGGGSRTVELELVKAVDTVGNESGVTGAGSVRVDAEGPTVVPLSLRTRRYSARPGFDQLLVPLQVSGASAVTVCVEGLSPPADAGGGPCRTHGADETESEWTVVDPQDGGTSPRLVLVSAVDEVGNRSQGSTTVIFDFDAPSVLDATFTYQSAPDCPVARVQAVGVDGGVAVRLSVDEVLGEPPRVLAPGLDFAAASASTALVWATRGFLRPGAPSGEVTPEIHLVDEVGNAAVRRLDASRLRLDATPPSAFGPNNRLIYRRAPWGDRTRPSRYFELGGPAGTFSPGSVVRIVGRVNGQDFVLNQASADADGGLPPTELFPIDFNTLAVIEFDDACNRGPAQQVPLVEWVVSFNGKAPGVPAPNPNRFLSVETAVPTSLAELGAREWGEAELASLDGGRAVQQGGAARWYRVGGALSLGTCLAPSPRGAEALVLDSSGGQVVPRRVVLDLDRRAWLFDAVPAPLVPDGPCASRGEGILLGRSGLTVSRFDGVQWTSNPPPPPASVPVEVLGVHPASGQPLAVRSIGGDGGVTTLWWQGDDAGWRAERVGDAGFLQALALSALGQAIVVTGCATADCAGPRQTWLRDQLGWRPAEDTWSITGAGVVCEDAVTPGLFLLGADAGFRLGDAGWVATRPPFNTAPAFCVVAPRDGGAVTLAIDGTGEVATWDGTAWTRLSLAAGARGEATGPASRHVLTNEPTGAPLWISSPDGGPASSWAWRGGEWTPFDPPPGSISAAAWSPSLGRVMVLGADAGATTLGGAWSATPGAPLGRTGMALGTYQATFVAFGGAAKQADQNDTWIWSGSWARVRDGGAAEPPPRSFAAVAEVPGRGLYLYGGVATTEQAVTPAPIVGSGGIIAGALVVTGGGGVGVEPGPGETLLSTQVALGDSWVWSGGSWVQLRPEVLPGPRARASLVWDDVNARLVLVGGVDLQDTWWLDPNETPPTWRDWTPLTGRVPANGRAVFSPDDDATLLNSASGTFVLVPEGSPAQRLVPSLAAANLPPGARLLSLEVDLVTDQGRVLQLWDGQRWVTAPTTLGPDEASRFLGAGLQLLPASGRRLSTDFAQVVVRYRP